MALPWRRVLSPSGQIPDFEFQLHNFLPNDESIFIFLVPNQQQATFEQPGSGRNQARSNTTRQTHTAVKRSPWHKNPLRNSITLMQALVTFFLADSSVIAVAVAAGEEGVLSLTAVPLDLEGVDGREELLLDFFFFLSLSLLDLLDFSFFS